MKTTRTITVLLLSSALLGGLGFALTQTDLTLATLLNTTVGTFAAAGLFGLMLWDTGRTLDSRKTMTHLEQRACANAHRRQHVALRRQAALAGC